MRRKFYLNKREGKLMGVCSGLADYTGVDALWIRIAAVLLFFAGFGSLLIAYIVVGLIANSAPDGLGDRPARLRLGRSDPDAAERDRGFGDIEAYYASSNPRLSRDIDSLR